MYKINDDYKNYIENNTSMSPKSKIVVDGIEYSGNVIKTVPKISHKNEKMFGGFPTKTCSFEIYDLDNKLNFENKEIFVYRGLLINGKIEYIPQGIFIPKADKITTNISQKSITFQNIEDKTQLFDTKYNSKLDWSTTHTGLEIVQEICDNLGVKLENEIFNWSNYKFKQPNFIENITNREVISRLAEIGGSIAFINRNGNLEIKEQTPTGHTIQRKRYGKLSRENQYGIINTVVLGKEGIDDDIVYPDPNMKNKIEWKILDNPYVDLYRKEMIEEVSKYIIGKSIIPFELTDFVDGNYLDLNDTITIIDRNGEEFTGVILNYENNSRIKSTIGANTQDSSLTNYKLAGSQKQSINEIKLLVDHINQIITALAKLTEENQTKVAELTLDVDSISQLVSKFADLTTTVEGRGTIDIDKIMTSELLYLHIYPTMTDLSYIYPSKNLFPSENLFMTTRDLIITTIDSETGEDKEVLRYTLPCDLHIINSDIKDELIIDYENKQIYCIHRVGFNEDGDKVPLEEEQKEYFEYKGIQLEEGTYKIFMECFEDAYINLRYAKQNELTSQFATQIEMNAAIKLAADEINLLVSKKISNSDGGVELASLIRQTAELIYLTANNFGWESQNSSMTTEGKLTAKNATLNSANIVGGNITLEDGAQIVGGNGLLTNLIYPGYTRGSMLTGSGDFIPLGHLGTPSDISGSDANQLVFMFKIPSNFTVKSAKVHLFHSPIYWNRDYEYDAYKGYGNSRNLKLYKITSSYIDINTFSGLFWSGGKGQEIKNAFGSNGFTGSTSSVTSAESIDIAKEISTGLNQLAVMTSESSQSGNQVFARTGGVLGYVEIIGYLK